MYIDLSSHNIKNKYFSSESNWSNKTFENKGKLSKITKSILTIDIIKEILEPLNPQIELVIKDINYIEIIFLLKIL